MGVNCNGSLKYAVCFTGQKWFLPENAVFACQTHNMITADYVHEQRVLFFCLIDSDTDRLDNGGNIPRPSAAGPHSEV